MQQNKNQIKKRRNGKHAILRDMKEDLDIWFFGL
jgi:hypothetical protein